MEVNDKLFTLMEIDGLRGGKKRSLIKISYLIMSTIGTKVPDDYHQISNHSLHFLILRFTQLRSTIIQKYRNHIQKFERQSLLL